MTGGFRDHLDKAIVIKEINEVVILLGEATALLNLGDMIIIPMKLWVIEVTEDPNTCMSNFFAHHVDRFTEFLKAVKIIFMGSIVSC